MNYAFKALKANRLKTSLIYLSLIFSISAIFLISSISNGVITMYSNMLQSDGDIIITQAKISDTFFSNVDLQLLSQIKALKEVKSASALIVGASPVEHLPIVAVYGVTKNRFKNYHLVLHDYPKADEVLVGKLIYDQLKNKKTIEIANKKFKVSGVFQSEIGFENGGVVVNIEDAGKIFNKSASMIMVNAKVDTNVDDLIDTIKGFSSKIEAKSTQNFVDKYNQFKIIKISSNTISFIAFCMGLLGIVSIMSITIHQRKSEFGIKRALGISMNKILWQIMSESLIIGFVSFISAFFVSKLILFLIKHSSHLQGYVNGEISSQLTSYVFIASMVMTVLGSLLPALNASKTDPVLLIQGNKI